MQKVAQKLHIIKQIYKEVMEVQRQSFQLKLECMGRKVEELKLKLKTLKVLKSQLACKTTIAKAVAPLSNDK